MFLNILILVLVIITLVSANKSSSMIVNLSCFLLYKTHTVSAFDCMTCESDRFAGWVKSPCLDCFQENESGSDGVSFPANTLSCSESDSRLMSQDVRCSERNQRTICGESCVHASQTLRLSPDENLLCTESEETFKANNHSDMIYSPSRQSLGSASLWSHGKKQPYKSEEKCRFGMKWGWGNHIFGWTFPLICLCK